MLANGRTGSIERHRVSDQLDRYYYSNASCYMICQAGFLNIF